jgi:hypothetical protein
VAEPPMTNKIKDRKCAASCTRRTSQRVPGKRDEGYGGYAVAELDGPQVAGPSSTNLDLGSYHAFHATRADLLRRLVQYDEVRQAYGQAIAPTENEAERAWLAGRQASFG